MHLTLHLTRACNLRCDYCYAPPDSGPGMTLPIARDALRLGARLTNGSCGIVFFGGEPLLCRERIQEIVAEAGAIAQQSEARFHFKITTNGLLLDPSFLDFAASHDLLVAISFDGIDVVHDRHRRLPDGTGTFDRLLQRLRMLLAVRPYSSVLMVVNPDTVEYLAESVAFLAAEGARYQIISINHGANWSEAQVEQLEGQLERLGDIYLEWSRRGRKFYLSPLEVKLASHILGDAARCHRCELGMRQLSVDPEGFVYPCVQFTRSGSESRWCIGHVSSGIDQEARLKLRDESLADKQPCVDCSIRHRCQNTCGCLNWQATGSVSRISPVLCRSEQKLTAVADRVGAILFKEQNQRFLQKHYDPAYPIRSLLEDLDVGSWQQGQML